jgi:hypothetical protein
MKKYLVLGSMALFALSIASLGTSQEAAEQACQLTLQNNCAKCHGLKKICAKLEQKDVDWKTIVAKMGAKGKLSQETQDAVFACLTTTSDPKKLTCNQ